LSSASATTVRISKGNSAAEAIASRPAVSNSADTAAAVPKRSPVGITASGTNDTARTSAPTTRLRPGSQRPASQRVMRNWPAMATRPDTANIAATSSDWCRGASVEACIGSAR
jgi:hypothetical protein